MALQDRIQNPLADSETAIAVHIFTAAFTLWVKGSITGTYIQSIFNMNAEEITQINNLKTAYDALAAAGKVDFLNKLECAGIMYEQGYISSLEYKTIMGL